MEFFSWKMEAPWTDKDYSYQNRILTSLVFSTFCLLYTMHELTCHVLDRVLKGGRCCYMRPYRMLVPRLGDWSFGLGGGEGGGGANSCQNLDILSVCYHFFFIHYKYKQMNRRFLEINVHHNLDCLNWLLWIMQHVYSCLTG